MSDELETVVDVIEESGSAHTFVLGDLIEDGESAVADRANVALVHEILSNASFPVTYLLGNHDLQNLTRDALSNVLGQERFYDAISVDGTPIIYLDSASERVGGPRGEVGPVQRGWLRETLPEYELPLVLLHHPVGNFDLSGNEWFEDYPERAFLGDRKEVLDVLEENGPVGGTVSGHLHQTQFSRFRGMPHVAINAFSKELPDEPITGTFALVDLDDIVRIEVETPETAVATYVLRT